MPSFTPDSLSPCHSNSPSPEFTPMKTENIKEKVAYLHRAREKAKGKPRILKTSPKLKISPRPSDYLSNSARHEIKGYSPLKRYDK